MASSTRASVMPRRTSCSSTMRSRSRAARASCQPAPFPPGPAAGHRLAPALPAARRRRYSFSQSFSPRSARVVREVEHQRGHRHVARVDRRVVGVLARLPRGRADADPEVAPAPGVLPLDDLLAVQAPAEPRERERPGAARRHVHVQERDGTVGSAQEEPGQSRGGPRGRAVARRGGRLDERHREAGNAQERGLERSGHRARVRHVVPEVRAGVDARDDDARPAPGGARAARGSRSPTACRSRRTAAAPAGRR